MYPVFVGSESAARSGHCIRMDGTKRRICWRWFRFFANDRRTLSGKRNRCNRRMRKRCLRGHYQSLKGLSGSQITKTNNGLYHVGKDGRSSVAKKTKTYNRRDSQMVTHSSTSRPVQCLCMAERTGCPVFTDLWSYVLLG